jgi:hypothetical protein
LMQFGTLIANILSLHSTHTSLETFHHLKQTTSVTNYIQRFEEAMSLMQMEFCEQLYCRLERWCQALFSVSQSTNTWGCILESQRA